MALVIGEVKPGFLTDGKDRTTVIPLPPQNGGAVGWGQVYLSFASDFGDAYLRIAVFNGGSWRVDHLVVKSAAGRVNYAIRDGDEKVSVVRERAGVADTGTFPVGWMIETTLKA